MPPSRTWAAMLSTVVQLTEGDRWPVVLAVTEAHLGGVLKGAPRDRRRSRGLGERAGNTPWRADGQVRDPEGLLPLRHHGVVGPLEVQRIGRTSLGPALRCAEPNPP